MNGMRNTSHTARGNGAVILDGHAQRGGRSVEMLNEMPHGDVEGGCGHPAVERSRGILQEFLRVKFDHAGIRFIANLQSEEPR